MQVPDTPTCDKLRLLDSQFDLLTSFIDYIGNQGIVFHKYILEECVSVNVNKVIYDFFGIDRAKLEEERWALLQYQRHLTERSEAT